MTIYPKENKGGWKMSIIKGDFLGFTFDGIHSSELGIFRVSDGSRYTENLLPIIQDKTVQVPGADGTYFFNSCYTQRQFSFPICFDSLTEEQLRKLKQVFGDKKIHDLIFDELPYKVYKVKVTGTPNLKYICFNEKKEKYEREDVNQHHGNLYGFNMTATDRIYKGEGQLSFVAYTPYAKSRYKYKDEYTTNNIKEWSLKNYFADEIYHNYMEWIDSVGLLNSQAKRDFSGANIKITKNPLDKYNNGLIYVYNPGDIAADFKIKIKMFEDEVKIEDKYIDIALRKAINDGADLVPSLGLKGFKLYEKDYGIQINTKLNLIEGIDKDGKITGTLYNKYIEKGSFFKLPNNEHLFLLIRDENGKLYDSDQAFFEGKIEIVYDYLFF